MLETDPGHSYKLDVYDSWLARFSRWLPAFIIPQARLIFMKREGEGYPGNVGHHAGTNCQEVIRALLARVRYLNGQIPHGNNDAIIHHLKECLWLLEQRAARRHGFRLRHFDFEAKELETAPFCRTCGHVICKGH